MQTLLERLAACANDADRIAFLASVPPGELVQLQGELTYAEMLTHADAAIDRLNAFTRALTEATDDDQRRQIILEAQGDRTRGSRWLSEWAWRRTATCDDWTARYREMIGRKTP